MSYSWNLFKGLGVVISGVIPFFANCTSAQIIPDTTLPNNSRTTTQDNITIIEGGTQAGNNLFHSFEQFSVPTGTMAEFHNTPNIENIISRVTGKSISNIDGLIKAHGQANLFLINPNGIIFGPNAALDIGGSFLASTASSVNFADNTKFSATAPQATPLLTVNVPIGLQFGVTAAPIRNQSQAQAKLEGVKNFFDEPVGLRVEPGKTIALVGGDIVLEGGNLTAASGRIELGSVAEQSLVSLYPSKQGWTLKYEGVQNFQNIQLIKRNVNGLEIPSVIDTSGKLGDGNLQIQGNSVELIGNFVSIINASTGIGEGGDITISSRQLLVKDGAQIITATEGDIESNLIVNASESVDLIGSYTFLNKVLNTDNTIYSGLVSNTFTTGKKAGNIIINTKRLRLQDGARILADSSGTVTANGEFIPAAGQGGNLIVNASEFVELIGNLTTGLESALYTSTLGPGDGGKISISTGQLIIRDGATISASNLVLKNVIYLGDTRNLGKAGEINITARSIILDNQGKLTSETVTGQGGNIILQVQDLLLLRRNSQISTNAGKEQAVGDGGNIFINAPNGFIVAQPGENSDITANAYTGSGGKVQINATGIFGITPRNRNDLARRLKTNNLSELDPQNLPTSDITAISQTNPNLGGIININTLDIDPNRGFTVLAVEPEEPKLAPGCASLAQNQSEFIITGRGGLPPNPREVLRNHSTQVNWVSLPETEDKETRRQGDTGNVSDRVTDSFTASPIVEAQGWVLDNNGDITLVANAPTTTPHSLWFNPASCNLYQ